MIQYRDGRDIVNINQDDSSGFRLDTLTTNKQYGLPTVQEHDVLTTRTDYVNKYPSTLQTTTSQEQIPLQNFVLVLLKHLEVIPRIQPNMLLTLCQW